MRFAIPSLGQRDQITAWLDESPVERYTAQESIQIALPVQGRRKPREGVVVVEACQPRGPMFLYALLGADIQAAAEGDLVLRIGISGNQQRRPFAAAGAPSWPDEAHYGIDARNAAAAIYSMAAVIARGDLAFSGMISICYGAETIGSSPEMFSSVGSFIPHLLYAATVPEALAYEVFGTKRSLGARR